MTVSGDARRQISKVWRSRQRFELEAGLRFARLAIELEQVGAHPTVVMQAQNAARDESRHAALCRSLAMHFGARDDTHAPRVPMRVAPSGLTPREAVLYEVIALSCVTETLSTALLGDLVERASDDMSRSALQSILKDEVQHARLGWGHLAAESRNGAANVVRDYLPAMLSATVKEGELFSRCPEPAVAEELPALGALTRRQRRDIFCRVLNEVVFPGLEQFGVDASGGRQWLEARNQVG